MPVLAERSSNALINVPMIRAAMQPNGMAHGYGAAVDVQPVEANSEQVAEQYAVDGERLVVFDQIKIISAFVQCVHQLFHRAYRRFNVAPTLARSPGTAKNPCNGFQLMFF